MKVRYFFLMVVAVASHIVHGSIAITYDPLLVVVLMVKNESLVIEATLQPFIDAGIDAYLIFDTGSTDDTVEKVERLFATYNVRRGIIRQEPFVDFATSRTRALALTEQQFPDACFMLMPDAEWYMRNVAGLLDFCYQHQHDICPVYEVRLLRETADSLHDFSTPRLIRAHNTIHFIGVVHELPSYITGIMLPDSVYFYLNTSEQGQEKSRKRWMRDLDLLLHAYEQNPHDPRTVFYLAQTYACLDDYESACLWLELRALMKGWMKKIL